MMCGFEPLDSRERSQWRLIHSGDLVAALLGHPSAGVVTRRPAVVMPMMHTASQAFYYVARKLVMPDAIIPI